MKKTSLFITAASMAFLFSCGGGETKTTETTEQAPVEVTAESVTYAVNTDESSVMWEGHTTGLKAYGHSGDIAIQEGTVDIAGEVITGGKIVIDMTTINPTDSAYTYDEKNNPENLAGHLSTGDFFLVDSFPTAEFVIKSHSGNQLVGDLTIRGNTKEETVEITNLEVTEEGFSGSGKLVFNRQDYEVSWVHFMKDVLLADDITLNIALAGSK